MLLAVRCDGDLCEAKKVWENKNLKSKFNSPVLSKGFVYGLDEGILTCIDLATGVRKWKGGRYGYGQLILASGHLVITTEQGEVALVEASPEAYREKAKFRALDGKTWNMPALADGVLYMRNEKEMAAFRITP
jgi:outer membrane protein assembly factor BamB